MSGIFTNPYAVFYGTKCRYFRYLLAIFVVLMGIGSVLGGIAKISTRLAILIGWFTCLAGSIMMQILFTLSIGMLGFGSGILMSVVIRLYSFTNTRSRCWSEQYSTSGS